MVDTFVVGLTVAYPRDAGRPNFDPSRAFRKALTAAVRIILTQSLFVKLMSSGALRWCHEKQVKC